MAWHMLGNHPTTELHPHPPTCIRKVTNHNYLKLPNFKKLVKEQMKSKAEKKRDRVKQVELSTAVENDVDFEEKFTERCKILRQETM